MHFALVKATNRTDQAIFGGQLVLATDARIPIVMDFFRQSGETTPWAKPQFT